MKIFAAIVAILVVWVMWPHVRQSEFLAPDPIAPGTWMATTADAYSGKYGRDMSTPSEGYGFRHFDTWNDPTLAGHPATRDDFQLQG